MAINIDQGLDIISRLVISKEKHRHYERVTELATLYSQLITGHNIDLLLHQFVRREDITMFNQRKLMTQAITPAVSATIMNPFYKVPRATSIIERIDFENTENFEDKKSNILEALKYYNGDRSLKGYMDARFVDLSFTDPNGFIVTEFDTPEIGALGEMMERVNPRPFEVSSYEAINYEYKNNELEWLLVRQSIPASEKYTNEEWYSYTLYIQDNAIKYTQIAFDTNEAPLGYSTRQLISENGIRNLTYFRAAEKELYLVETFDHKAGKVPAKRIGYKMDLVTNGETFVNPMHDALCYFMKSIKTVSEFDLTMALHAFPQKFQYAPKCSGVNEISCDGGRTQDGSICGQCKGTGYSLHTSAQDAVMMRMPKKGEDIIDLEQLVHYEYPPIELLNLQNQYILQLKQEASEAVFVTNGVIKSSTTKTATEMDYSYEGMYDTLFPFAEAYSNMYKFIVKVTASFRDIPDIIIEYKFPKDFKFKTVSELLAELKAANDSSAPNYIRQELTLDIAHQQFIDKPEELKRIRIKQSLYPFPDKTSTEIVFIIANNLTSKYNEVLWANFDNIFASLERDAEMEGKYFYDYNPELIKGKLYAKVAEYIVEEPVAIPFGTTVNNDIDDEGATS